jgi:hypothetical protein
VPNSAQPFFSVSSAPSSPGIGPVPTRVKYALNTIRTSFTFFGPKPTSAHIPAVELCASCHRAVGSYESEDLTQLRLNSGIYEDQDNNQVIVDSEMASPINWRRVHRLPDHVRFVHSAHINYLTNNPSAIENVPDHINIEGVDAVPASQVCSTCHGDVANMEKVYQVEPLKMGQCVNCHRKNGGPTDCAACHH